MALIKAFGDKNPEKVMYFYFVNVKKSKSDTECDFQTIQKT